MKVLVKVFLVASLIAPSVGLAIDSLNTFGMYEVHSAESNLIISVPWTFYSKVRTENETNAPLIPAFKLVKTENLTPGDMLLMLSNNYDRASTYAAWQVNSMTNDWVALDTVARLDDGSTYHVTAQAGGSNRIERGYGLWLCRQQPLDEKGEVRPFWLYGQFVTYSVTNTMLSHPQCKSFNINDLGWTNLAICASDTLIVNLDQSASVYCQWNATQGKWWYPYEYEEEITKVVKGVTKTATIQRTERKTDIIVPAGKGFWYVRRAADPMTFVWPNQD